MSQYERRLDLLNKNRVIYRRKPTTDKPSESYDWGDFYETGTHQYYNLFYTKAKITTYKSLKWHLYVLWYLNPDMDQDLFKAVVNTVCKKENGFVTFRCSKNLIDSVLYDVSMMDLEKAPPNKLRKIIFKDYTGLDMRQKLSIVGKMIGRARLSGAEIYDAMLLINNEGEKITIAKVAKYLKCSTRTIYRNMSNELKREKELLNQQI